MTAEVAATRPAPAPDQALEPEEAAFVATFLVKRKDGMSFDAFMSHQIETHIPLALQLPGLEDYRIRFFPSANGTDQAFDALVDVTFTSAAAYEAAMGSAEGQQALADLPNMLDMDAMAVLVAGDRYRGRMPQ